MTERKKAVSIIDTAFYVNYISGPYCFKRQATKRCHLY